MWSRTPTTATPPMRPPASWKPRSALSTSPTAFYISIYTVDGTLVRRLGPTSGSATTLDWDLHNHDGIPIAGGVYLIHFKVPGIGERVVKWFGTMRPVDLNSFGF